MARLYWQGTSEEEAFPPLSVHGYRVLPWPGLALAPHIRFQPSAGCVRLTHARSILSIPRRTPLSCRGYCACMQRPARISDVHAFLSCVHASPPPSSSPPQCRRDFELIVVCELGNWLSYLLFLFVFAWSIFFS